MKTFVFWHPYLVFHLAPYIKELSLRDDCRVVVCAQESLPASYKNSGYPIPDHGLAEVYVSPNKTEMQRFFSIKNSHHIFLGLRAFSMIKNAYRISKKYQVYRYLMSENRDEPGLKSCLRMLLYKIDAFFENKFISGVFCIGARGERGGRDFFIRAGYPEKKIHAFRYVVERFHFVSYEKSRDVVNFIYVGQLIDRKGIDFLLNAFSRFPEPFVKLTIVGSGIGKDMYLSLAKSLGVDQRITWKGNLANSEVKKLISMSSALILPSRFDGWGAVVNEALNCGCPVICSDRCGAHELIEDGCNGFVFDLDDPDGLYNKMQQFVNAGVEWSQADIVENSIKFGPEDTADLFLEGIKIFSGC